MSKPRVTPWFPADVKPVRVGVYETVQGGLEYFNYWDGLRWHGAMGTPQDAETFATCHNPSWENAPQKWRGLARKPRSAKAPQS